MPLSVFLDANILRHSEPWRLVPIQEHPAQASTLTVPPYGSVLGVEPRPPRKPSESWLQSELNLLFQIGPAARRGVWGWLTTTDHKKIGILYGSSAIVFFVVGGIEALLIRVQLATPNGEFLSADAYNQMFTMHATTMVFLVIMPAAGNFSPERSPWRVV